MREPIMNMQVLLAQSIRLFIDFVFRFSGVLKLTRCNRLAVVQPLNTHRWIGRWSEEERNVYS